MKKVRSGVRVLLSPEMWRVALGEARRGRRRVPAPPPPTVVEEDRDAGLRRVEIGGHDYWLPLAMDWSTLATLHPEVFSEEHPHYYEYGGCRVRPGDVVIDAGAAEGFFTRFAVERGARVVAVEPWAPMAEGLRRTFAAEIAAGTVRVEQASLAAEPGRATLRLDPSQPWGAHVGDGIAPGDVAETVPQLTVDAMVAAGPWGRCDFLKMDVEGAEREVVRGARETLRRDRPCLAIAVYHSATGYLDIRRELRAAGVGYRVEGKGLHRYNGLYIPVILHAWPAGRGGPAGGVGP